MHKSADLLANSCCIVSANDLLDFRNLGVSVPRRTKGLAAVPRDWNTVELVFEANGVITWDYLLDILSSVPAGSSCHFFKAIVRNRQRALRFKASGVFTPFSVCRVKQ